MSDTWSPDPPTEPGRYWRAQSHSCGKCWKEIEGVQLMRFEGCLLTPFTAGQVLASKELLRAEDYRAMPRVDTLWGPKIEDPEPPPVPGGEEDE